MLSKRKHSKPTTTINFLESTPKQYRSSVSALNVAEEKIKFLSTGALPEFKLKGSADQVCEVLQNANSHIRFGLFHYARNILDAVVKTYGDLDKFLQASYGSKITPKEATPLVHSFLQDHGLDGQIKVIWTPDLQCSGLMMSTGPSTKCNMPEKREFTLLLKSSNDNNFLSEYGIICLIYHEVGTHYMRSYNDGFQPWYYDRSKFGLSKIGSIELLRNEEGLATLHTIYNSKAPYLAGCAFTYYAACLAAFLDFKNLYEHLEKYVHSPDARWKCCVRIKRVLTDSSDKGGLGKDQRYFEGAVEILMHLEEIDFRELMAGKLCWDELSRVRRVLRTGSLRYPDIMNDMKQYRKRLEYIRKINGLDKILKNLEQTVARTEQELFEELCRYDIYPQVEICGIPDKIKVDKSCGCFPNGKRKKRRRKLNGRKLRVGSNKTLITPIVPLPEKRLVKSPANTETISVVAI